MWVYNFRIHLTCKEISFPQKGDRLLVEILLAEGHTGDGLCQLNRVRIYLQMIFLSDIAAADGRKLDPSYLRPAKWDSDASIYTFPREKPSAADWRAWRNFWESYVDAKGVLPHTLGHWMAPTHRKWQWHYDKQNDVIQRDTGVGVERFHRDVRGTRTRWGTQYVKVLAEECVRPCAAPATVEMLGEERVRLISTGSQQVKAALQRDSFWGMMHSWGGGWMWEHTTCTEGDTA